MSYRVVKEILRLPKKEITETEKRNYIIYGYML